MSGDVILAVAANIIALLAGLATLHHWQQETRRRVEERHEENRNMLQDIQTSIAEMRGKVEILWQQFLNR